MIKSILGGKSKNLFDISKVITSNEIKRSGNNLICSVYGTSIGTLGSICPTLKLSDTITVSFKCTSEGVASNFMSMSNTSGGLKIFRSGETFPVSEVGLSAKWYLYSTDYAHRDIPNKTTYSDIQIELGSTATEYVPHELTSYKSIMKVSDVCQLLDKSKYPATRTNNGITFTNNGDGSFTIDGTISRGLAVLTVAQISNLIVRHKYYSSASKYKNGVYVETKIDRNNANTIWQSGVIHEWAENETTMYISLLVDSSSTNTVENAILVPQLFDLTEMFGAGNEPKTVAEFKAKFPNDYYPYSPSCFVTSFDERMPCKTKNLFDKSNADIISREYYFTPNQGAGSNFYVMTVKPGITYTVTYERFIKSTDTDSHNALELSVQTGTHYKDGTQLLFRVGNGERGVWVKRSGQFTIPSDINQVTFSGLKDRFLYRNFMVQEGTTATDYVPYGYV